ncbi:MAG: ATP-binding protein [candidate division WOR-3 bacterium]|nr:ATP-binding protein [candidate division WOR-3 bacterium]
MDRPLWRQPEFWTTVAAVVVLSVGHYTAPTHDPFWHDLFRRLYYLPIILAAFRYGLSGGLVTSILVSLLFLPHVLMTRAMLPRQASEAVFEIPLYLIVGIVTGILSDRQRKANESLRRAERLRTLGEMAAGMAHEVKNPLAAIRSSAQILAGHVSGKDAEFAGIVVSEVDRLNKVVNEFLEYARPAPLKREPVKLSAVLDSCLELLAPVIKQAGVAVKRTYPSDEGTVDADSAQLRQVFLNLILNAIQAVENQGSVEVSVRESGRETQVTVKDNGPGIPPDKLTSVFEPFYTTKPGGTGLGLPIAQRIVAEHGGRLVIESTPGEGTTATVILPGG